MVHLLSRLGWVIRLVFSFGGLLGLESEISFFAIEDLRSDQTSTVGFGSHDHDQRQTKGESRE